MTEIKLKDPVLPLPEVVNGAVGPFDPYCMGYSNPGASGYGYISTLKLSTGVVSTAGLDPGTEGIVSYDRCEKNDAYIGQINMLTASSFCGVNGAVWGYHLAVADQIANGSLKPMYYQDEPKAGKRIPVFPVKPLLDCAMRLFGTEKQRRFPPMPGAHVICANKNTTANGPTWVWAAIALAIADDRETAANLFIEDCNSYGNQNTPEAEVIKYLEKTQHNVTKSMVMCGVDQGVVYSKIFCGYKYQFASANHVGCSLTCAPYVVLAKNAVPANQPASSIIDMTISQWEKAVKLPPLVAGTDEETAEHRAAS
ncbi:MAG: histidine decarboxylase [Acidobacteria bacterium]|nr:MAG: histidine decarboxylase [Acidobacteriota bacterium]